MRPLNDLAYPDLLERFGEFGLDESGARRLLAAIHARGDFEVVEPPPGLRRDVVTRLREGRLARLRVLERRRADDGFVKYLFESPLGGLFEAVRIPIFETKYIVCVSSQVGCALRCAFCDTGKLGFARNLASWEMVEQVRIIRDEADRPVRGTVFMGMGEPLLNYDNVVHAAHLLATPGGIQIGGRNISISTAGVVPAIRRYTREGHPYRLTFSVTSAIPEKRAALMPIEQTHPLPELVDAIRQYAESRRDRAMIAYVAISGFNTGREDAEALRDLFAGVPIKLDLIDVNDASGRYQPPSLEELNRFRDDLQILRSPIARRYSGGKEIGAACGNLAARRTGGTVLPGQE